MENSTRYVTEKYPVKCVFIDMSRPWNRGISENVFMALMKFFATASNVVGTTRIPALGVFVIGKQAECIFPLQAVKTNIAKLMHVLHEVKIQDGVDVEESAYQETLSAAVKQAFNQFSRSFYANKQQHWSSLTQIEACFITCQPQGIVERCLEMAFGEKHLEYLKKIQIIQVEDGYNPVSTFEEKSLGFEADTVKLDALHDYLEFVKVSNCSSEVEFVLKSWLVDYGIDDVQIIIDINGTQPTQGIEIKCDLNDRILSLSMVPSYQQKLFQIGAQQLLCNHCQSSLKNPSTNANVYHFKSSQLIQLDGICESIVYGQPLILRPTSCWKLDWEELDLNQQRFQAIRSFLAKQEVGMLLESKETGVVSTPKTFCILLPSNGCGMLLKCVANADVLLPLSSSLCIQKESEEVQNEVESMLLEVPKSNLLNPLCLKAGISDKLMMVFESNEMKRNAKGLTRKPYADTPRTSSNKSIMEVKPSHANSSRKQMNSQPAKRARCPYKSLPNKGSIFTRDPPEFPENF